MTQGKTMVDFLRIASLVGIVAVGESCPKTGEVEDAAEIAPPQEVTPPELLSLDKIFKSYEWPKSPLDNLNVGDIVNRDTGDIVVSVDECYGTGRSFRSSGSIGSFEAYLGTGANINVNFFIFAGASADAKEEYTASYTDVQKVVMTGMEQLQHPCQNLIEQYSASNPDTALRQVVGIIKGDYIINELQKVNIEAEGDVPFPLGTIRFGGGYYRENSISTTVNNATILVKYSEKDATLSQCKAPDSWESTKYNGHCYFFSPPFTGLTMSFLNAQAQCNKFGYELPVVGDDAEFNFLTSKLKEQGIENAWINLGCVLPEVPQNKADLGDKCQWLGSGAGTSLGREKATAWYYIAPEDKGSRNGVLFIEGSDRFGSYQDRLRVASSNTNRWVMCEEK